MKSETTTCMSIEHIFIVNNLAKRYNVAVTEIITALIRYAAQNKKFLFVSNRRIQYRDRRGKTSWKRVHIMVKPHDYEIFLDAKKLFKMSVAKMIEFCIENFIFECIKNVFEKNNTDNYLYANYHYEFSTEGEIYSYHVYWGIPQRIITKILKTSEISP